MDPIRGKAGRALELIAIFVDEFDLHPPNRGIKTNSRIQSPELIQPNRKA